MSFDLQEFIGNTGLHLPEDGASGRRAITFATGANHPQDILGFASVGIPPGLDADRLVARDGEYPDAVAAITRLAGTGMPVLLNSGSFKEFVTGVPIDDMEWRLRLDLYERMAQDFGRQLYLVAPDKLNDQEETLARLELYAFDMHLLALAGANVLLNMGSGDMAPDKFLAVAEDLLGAKVIPSFPMHEGLAHAHHVIDYVRSTHPEKIHLMGLKDGKESQDLLTTLWGIQPDLMISQDALFLRPSGQTNTPEQPSLIWDNVEPLADLLEEQGALMSFFDAWRGWLVHEVLAEDEGAHQFTNVEGRFTAELGRSPDLASEAFAQGLRAFRALNSISRPAASC